MKTPVLTLSYRTAAGIAAYLIAAAGSEARAAVVATGPTDPLIGTVGELGSEAGGMADIAVLGIDEVRLGGTVANGDPLTSDAAGKAVKAVETADTSVRIIGFAESDGDANDIIPFRIAPGYLSNPSA